MHRLLRILSWIFLLLVFLAGILFSFFNTEPVALSFGFKVMQPMPLSVWVISAFALGGLTGLVLGAGLFSGMRTRMEMRRLTRKVETLENARANVDGSAARDAE
ncbi:MAG: LapA family protein [Pseudohongiellaceae bacterium]